MTPMSRRLKIASLIVAYFVVWFGFGLIYRLEANRTNGSAFAFSEDVRMQSIARELHKEFGEKVSIGTIRELLRSSRTPPFMSPIGSPEGKNIYAFQEIGNQWASFYSELLYNTGTTHFKLQPLQRETYPLEKGAIISLFQWVYELTVNKPPFKPFLTPLDLDQSIPPSSNYRLELFRDTGTALPMKNSDTERLSLQRTHIVWLTKEPLGQVKVDSTIAAYNVALLPLCLRYSLVFLDEAPIKVANALKGHREYPLLDFLYFSAITITTLGFGDIVPNDTVVRVLVMCESMIGLLIAGALIAILFSSHSESNDSKRDRA